MLTKKRMTGQPACAVLFMINIQNIYYMLAYAFEVLHTDQYANLANEPFAYTSDLLAAILAKGMASQVRRGLSRSYLPRRQALRSPAGKIEISESVRQQTMLRRQLICERDVFTEDIPVNRILKSTALALLSCPDVVASRKQDLKKVLLFFANVSRVDLHHIRWDAILFDRNNATYRLLLYLCRLVAEHLLMSEQEGRTKWKRVLDDQKMHQLFERFVRAYYKKHYPQCRVAAAKIDWNLTEGTADFLPAMKSDTTISYEDKALIIDTKYYSHTMQFQAQYQSRTLHSGNLYQIFTYVKNSDVLGSGNVSGLLLYAKTDEAVTPDADYCMGGNHISIKTLDLGQPFTNIAAQLDHYLTLIGVETPLLRMD